MKYLVTSVLGKTELFENREEAIKVAYSKRKQKHYWRVLEMPEEEAERFLTARCYYSAKCIEIYNTKKEA